MKVPKFSLEGKVALVTGGSRGIGRAIALTFADAGASVVVSARKLPALEEVAEEVKAMGRKCLPISSHIDKLEQSKNLVDRVMAEFGRIDVLMNTVGGNPTLSTLLDMEEWNWDKVMDVNLKGGFLLSQLVARIMKGQGGGSIINMSSVGGVRPGAELPAYNVAKAAVIALTKIMAAEWGKYNIRVNVLAPGTIKTHFSEYLWKPGSVGQVPLSTIALGRYGEPEDIAGAALYLASDASSYVTGETIVIDGGEVEGNPR